MAILGRNTQDATDFGSAQNYALYARYQTDGSGGTVAKIHAYVKNTSGSARNVQMAIYSDDAVNNLPESPILTPVTITVSASLDGEINANYVIALSASTWYWLAIVDGTSFVNTHYSATGAGDSGYYNIGSGTLPDPFSHSANSVRTWEYDIWVDYAAAGGVTTSGTVTDTLAILDSPSNTYIGVVAKTEAASALDSPSNTYIGRVAKIESASATDSPSNTFIGVVSGIELASLSDSPSNTMIGRVAAAESANAQDTPSVTYIAIMTNSETISAIDVPGASYIGRVSLAELASAIDASDWKVEWSVNVVEAGVAVDSPSNTFIGRSAILEAMTAQDTPSSTYIGLVAALESVGATDAFSFIAADIWAVSVTESMTVKDICSAILSSYVEEEAYRPFRKHWHFHPVLRDGEGQKKFALGGNPFGRRN